MLDQKNYVEKIINRQPLGIKLNYINTCEIPGFFLFLKHYIFIARSEDTIFIFHM